MLMMPSGGLRGDAKNHEKKPFTGGTRGSAALASGLILLRRRPKASKAIAGTTRPKRSANARSLGTSRCPILRGCAHGRAAQAGARGEQFLSILRPLDSLKISKRLRLPGGMGPWGPWGSRGMVQGWGQKPWAGNGVGAGRAEGAERAGMRWDPLKSAERAMRPWGQEPWVHRGHGVEGHGARVVRYGSRVMGVHGGGHEP